MLRQKLISKVHVLKNKAKLDDDVYRLTLLRITGKESCKDLSIKELEEVLEEFTNRGINNQPFFIDSIKKSNFEYFATKCSKLRKIIKMWIELAEISKLRDGSDKGLNSFLEHKFNTSLELLNNINTNTNTTKDKVIEALNHMSKRAIKKVMN